MAVTMTIAAPAGDTFAETITNAKALRAVAALEYQREDGDSDATLLGKALSAFVKDEMYRHERGDASGAIVREEDLTT